MKRIKCISLTSLDQSSLIEVACFDSLHQTAAGAPKFQDLLFESFGKPSHNAMTPSSKVNITGCNTSTPLACAIAPIANGNTAPPIPPSAVANPIELTCKWFGRSFKTITTPAGNNGPREKPNKHYSNNRHSEIRHEPEDKLEGYSAG